MFKGGQDRSSEWISRNAGRRAMPIAALLVVAAVGAGCGESGTATTVQQASSTTPGASATTEGAATERSGPAAVSGQATTATSSTTPTAGAPASTRPASPGQAPRKRSRARLVLPPPNSHPEPAPSASERSSLPVADISLSSPAVRQAAGSGTYTISRTYTCAGGDRTPPLHWRGVPAGTKELALLVVNAKPVGGHLFFDWAVAGIAPSARGLQSGSLPAGAIVGRNGFGHLGYSICPAGGAESYLFLLYALPKGLGAKAGFEPEALRVQAMHTARHTGILAASDE